jgi:hypothetical protein
MATCDYYPSNSEPSLSIKKAADGDPISFYIMYVDDGGIIKIPDDIKEVISALGKVFKVKTMGEMEKLVGCHIIDTKDKSTKVTEEFKGILQEHLKSYKENLHNSFGSRDSYHPP